MRALFLQIQVSDDGEFLRCEAAWGKCQVMCFHPHSNVTLPLMSHDEIRLVVDEWAKLSRELGSKYNWVQVILLHSDLVIVSISLNQLPVVTCNVTVIGCNFYARQQLLL